jgi:hypothetical protein
MRILRYAGTRVRGLLSRGAEMRHRETRRMDSTRMEDILILAESQREPRRAEAGRGVRAGGACLPLLPMSLYLVISI